MDTIRENLHLLAHPSGCRGQCVLVLIGNSVWANAGRVSEPPNRAVELGDVAQVTEALSVSIGYALWGQWGEIATQREHAARAARGQMLAEHRHGVNYAPVRAVDLLFDVLTTCRDDPKLADEDARKWAVDYSPAIDNMVTQLRVSRDTMPLLNDRGPATS